jgi:phage host-nuclease inhibitor protein Gam
MAAKDTTGAVLGRIEQKVDGLVETVTDVREEVRRLATADSAQAARLAVHDEQILNVKGEVKTLRGYVMKAAGVVLTAVVLAVLASVGFK